jgi:putative ABC transport system permease protein
MRRGISITGGRWFQSGQREVVVGQSVAKRYPTVGLGGKIRFGRGDWQVVGIMRSGHSAINSEIFCDLNQLAADDNRADVLSSVLLRAIDPVAKTALIRNLKEDQRLNVDALSETEYYDRQTSSSAPIFLVGMLVAVIMSIGSSFSAMNTMYAAVAYRSQEIGTLRVLGFSRREILASFLVESVIVALLGGMVGCLLVLPLHNMTSGIGSFSTFSETTFQFRVTPAIMGTGMLFALFMGAFGGVLPARNAAVKEIVVALRSV